MTDLNKSDLASLRAIAEEGRYSPLAGGRYLVTNGFGVAISMFGIWALTQAQSISQTVMGWTLTFIILAFVSSIFLSHFLHKGATFKLPQNTMLSKAEAVVWNAGGIAIGVYLATILIRLVLGLETPQVVFGLVGVFSFLIYGISFSVTAELSKQKWLRIPAFGSMVTAFIIALIAERNSVLLVTGLMAIPLAVIPGIILMRQEKRI